MATGHRKPPVELLPAKKGRCRLCGAPTRSKHASWHDGKGEPQCVRDWHIAQGNHSWARQSLITRNGGEHCAICNRANSKANPLEVDHIVPLYCAPREWKYWTLENLQLICHHCHSRKSAIEQRERQRGQERPEVEAPRRMREVRCTTRDVVELLKSYGLTKWLHNPNAWSTTYPRLGKKLAISMEGDWLVVTIDTEVQVACKRTLTPHTIAAEIAAFLNALES